MRSPRDHSGEVERIVLVAKLRDRVVRIVHDVVTRDVWARDPGSLRSTVSDPEALEKK